MTAPAKHVLTCQRRFAKLARSDSIFTILDAQPSMNRFRYDSDDNCMSVSPGKEINKICSSLAFPVIPSRLFQNKYGALTIPRRLCTKVKPDSREVKQYPYYLSLQAPNEEWQIEVTHPNAVEEEASLNVAQVWRAHVSMCDSSASFQFIAPR